MHFDRYTLLKWKEASKDFTDTFSGRLAQLYALCNATPVTRLITLGSILAAVLLISGLIGLMHPEPPVPLSKRLVLTRTDDLGDTWTMDYLKNQNLQAILNGPVKPGEPLTLTVKLLQEQGNLYILPEIAGAAGERYLPGILKNGQWQEPPRFTITDANGNRLHQGQFEYG